MGMIENEFTPDKTANYYNNADNNLKEQVLMSYEEHLRHTL